MTQSKREQAMVGLLVLVAGALLVGTVVALCGVSGRHVKIFRAYFPFAGGVEAGTTVRYSGGPKVGRVEKVGIDPENASRIEVTFSVDADLPVKMDSRVKIMSMTPLGDNHVEVLPGTSGSAIAPSGTLLPSNEYVDLNSLMAQIQDIAPQAQQLIKNLDNRVTELKVTVDRVNDLLSAQNRSNLSATLAETLAMIQETRPRIKSTLDNVNEVSGHLQPVLDDLRKTMAQAYQTLDHVDALIGENRPDIHQAVLELRKSLAMVTSLTGRLDQTVDVNSENFDEALDNLRDVSENLKELTDKLKARRSRPSSWSL